MHASMIKSPALVNQLMNLSREKKVKLFGFVYDNLDTNADDEDRMQ